MEHIDEIIHQRLKDAEVAPPAFVWPNVERVLHRRRRGVLLWWLMGGSTVLLAVIGLKLATLKHSGGGAQDQADLVGSWKFEVRGSNTSGQRPMASNQQPATSNQQPATSNQQPTTSNQQPATSNQQPTTNNESSIANGPQSTVNGQRSTVNSPRPTVHGQQSTINSQPSTAQSNAPKTENKSVEAPEVAINTLPDDIPAALSRQSFLLLDKKEAVLTRLPAKAQKFPHVRPMVKKKPSKYKNCYDFNTHPNVFLVDAYIGPSMARKDLRSVKAEESWYRQSRLTTESRDWAFNAGVRGTLLFNQNFLLRAGLHYDQIVETFQYVDQQYRVEKTKQVWDPVTSSWKTISNGWEYGEHYTKTYNRFGMLDIPLQAGVEVRNGRSGVSIQAGASLNILFWKSGSILSPQEQPASFTPADHELDVFRARTGLSVMGSVQWFYHLRPRWRVFAEPYFRQVLRPVTVDAHPVEQRYGIGGVRLGLTRIMAN